VNTKIRYFMLKKIGFMFKTADDEREIIN
jgi:hypothetical protein